MRVSVQEFAAIVYSAQKPLFLEPHKQTNRIIKYQRLLKTTVKLVEMGC
jgi:hypothetical protein